MDPKNPNMAKRMDIDLACQYYDSCYKSFEDNSSTIEGWSVQESLATWQSERLDLALTSGEDALSALENTRKQVEDYSSVLNGSCQEIKEDLGTRLKKLDDEEAKLRAKLAELMELKEKPVHDKGQRL